MTASPQTSVTAPVPARRSGESPETETEVRARRERFVTPFVDQRAQITGLRDAGVYPLYPVLDPARQVINLATNDYLGLRHDDRVIAAAHAACSRYGTGSCASPLVGGHTTVHEQLQRDLARFLEMEQAQLTASGYQANLTAVAGLLRPGDFLVADRYIHASLIDASRLAQAELRLFPHNDPSGLEAILAALEPERRVLVAVEGLYSADGDLGALEELCRIAHRFDALIMIDEAHSVGVVGPDGRGAAHACGVAHRADLITGTMSKALGTSGGFLAGDATVMDILCHTARPLLFSAALPPATAAAARQALQILHEEPEHREVLWRNTRTLLDGLQEAGFDTMSSSSPVIPVLVGDDLETFTLATHLRDAGIVTTPGVYPMVPRGRSRIRMHATAAHDHAQLRYVLDVFTTVKGGTQAAGG